MNKATKGYMSFADGFRLAPSIPDAAEGFRQIDWDQLKSFIEENKDKISQVSAGLLQDWDCTSGQVWDSEKGYIPRSKTYVYGASRWATPGFDVIWKGGIAEAFECWKLGDVADAYFNLDEEDKQ